MKITEVSPFIDGNGIGWLHTYINQGSYYSRYREILGTKNTDKHPYHTVKHTMLSLLLNSKDPQSQEVLALKTDFPLDK